MSKQINSNNHGYILFAKRSRLKKSNFSLKIINLTPKEYRIEYKKLYFDI